MATKQSFTGMSDLERELELEMDEELEQDEEVDEELEGVQESDREGQDVLELDEESGADQETGDQESNDLEIEAADRNRDQEYADRFLEIASRQFESEAEVDQAMHETLDGMASEYLFGGLLSKARRLAKSRLLRSLIKKGLSVASGQFPALKAAMALANGNLRGAIVNLGKQALGAAIPGGGAVLGALGALGFKRTDKPEENREAWENYAQMSREAYEHLADNVSEVADEPLEASRLASNAFQHAVKRAQARVAAGGVRRGLGRRVLRGNGRVIRVRVRPGQTIVITGGHKLIVRGL